MYVCVCGVCVCPVIVMLVGVVVSLTILGCYC